MNPSGSPASKQTAGLSALLAIEKCKRRRPGRPGWFYSLKNDSEGEKSREAALSMPDTGSQRPGRMDFCQKGPEAWGWLPAAGRAALCTVGARMNLPLTLKERQREVRGTNTSMPMEQEHSGVQNIFTWERWLLG